MIQRIQTLYLLVAMTCLGIVCFGSPVYHIEDKGYHGHISALGKTIFTHENKLLSEKFMPLFILPLVLILLCIWTLLTFKKLKSQLQLGRATFIVYLLALAFVAVHKFMAPQINHGADITVSFGIGFYIFALGLPFVFLANQGIKKDKKLLDSLNRLR